MKIGILSDTHDNIAAIEAALREFTARGVELVLHCGDIQSPTTVASFASIPTHFVLGNCDFEAESFAPAMQLAGAKLYEPFGELELCGKKIGWIHSHDM